MVLVVEDDPRIQQFIRTIVGSAHRCVCVPSVASGLDEVSAAHFDLVVLDIALCDGRGTELLRAMRARGDRTPVVVVSGRATWDEACEMDCLDVAARFAKPHLQGLRQKIAEVLAAGRETGELAGLGLDTDDAVLPLATVKAAAARAGLSPSGLSRRLKSRFGIGAKTYMTQRRLARVKALLIEEKLSVAQIADSLGFCEASHLSRWVKRLAGCSPAEFRKRHRLRVDLPGCDSSRDNPFPGLGRGGGA